jgi:hypothetical protein
LTPSEDHQTLIVADDGTLDPVTETITLYGERGYFTVDSTVGAFDYATIIPVANMVWHPYPIGYQVTNLDLQEQFEEDVQGGAVELTTLLTDENSTWKWLGDYMLAVDTTIVGEEAWEQAVIDFFAAQNAFATAGQPEQWEQTWWNATFPTDLLDGTVMPKVKRHGWVLENWRYGNEDGYYHASEESKLVDNTFDQDYADSTHIWARWLELRVMEGFELYNETADTSAIDLRGRTITAQDDLVLLLDGKKSDMAVTRTLVGGKYNAVSLPFAINANTIKQVTDREGNYIFDAEQGGNTPEIYLFDVANVVLTSDYDSELKLQFHLLKEGEEVAANQPFIIKPKEDIVTDFIFYDVDIVNPVKVESNGDGVEFRGLFISASVTPEADYKLIEIVDGELQEHTEGVTLKGLNGYFMVSPALPAYDYAVIVLDNGVSTDIINIDSVNKSKKVLINNQVFILHGDKVYTITGKQ